MKGIKLNFDERTITMTRKFAALAEDPRTNEYNILQNVRRDYPNFEVRRHTIKKNVNKKTYAGLDYDYMREYIDYRESAETRSKVRAELEEMILISRCHSKAYRYPVIKQWFLNKYEEIQNYGCLPEIEDFNSAEDISVITIESVKSNDDSVEDIPA